MLQYFINLQVFTTIFFLIGYLQVLKYEIINNSTKLIPTSISATAIKFSFNKTPKLIIENFKCLKYIQCKKISLTTKSINCKNLTIFHPLMKHTTITAPYNIAQLAIKRNVFVLKSTLLYAIGQCSLSATNIQYTRTFNNQKVSGQFTINFLNSHVMINDPQCQVTWINNNKHGYIDIALLPLIYPISGYIKFNQNKQKLYVQYQGKISLHDIKCTASIDIITNTSYIVIHDIIDNTSNEYQIYIDQIFSTKQHITIENPLISTYITLQNFTNVFIHNLRMYNIYFTGIINPNQISLAGYINHSFIKHILHINGNFKTLQILINQHVIPQSNDLRSVQQFKRNPLSFVIQQSTQDYAKSLISGEILATYDKASKNILLDLSQLFFIFPAYMGTKLLDEYLIANINLSTYITHVIYNGINNRHITADINNKLAATATINLENYKGTATLSYYRQLLTANITLDYLKIDSWLEHKPTNSTLKIIANITAKQASIRQETLYFCNLQYTPYFINTTAYFNQQKNQALTITIKNKTHIYAKIDNCSKAIQLFGVKPSISRGSAVIHGYIQDNALINGVVTFSNIYLIKGMGSLNLIKILSPLSYINSIFSINPKNWINIIPLTQNNTWPIITGSWSYMSKEYFQIHKLSGKNHQYNFTAKGIANLHAHSLDFKGKLNANGLLNRILKPQKIKNGVQFNITGTFQKPNTTILKKRGILSFFLS